MPSPTPAAYINTRRIGDATVTLISEGTFPWALELQAPEAAWRGAMPEVDAEGRIILDNQVVLIRSPGAVILVDPGFDDPAQPPPDHFPGLVRSPGLMVALETLDLAPGDITHVLITHTHSDHFAGVTVERADERLPRFPHARHLLGRLEWEGNPERDDPSSALVRHLGTVERARLLDLVDGEHEVISGVTMIHAPGESPGHAIVRLRSAGETFYALGDLFHHACEVAHLDWVSSGRDAAAMRHSRERLLADAVASRATLVFTHERFPGWGRVERGDGGYRWVRASASMSSGS
jgi:glyoxylase-like metal-dependent hydrolase (beta-lactamase superfamily II)